MSQPPPLPSQPRSGNRRAWKIIITIVVCTVLIGAGGIFLLVHYVTASGITRPIDNIFGDQHLKTAVALIELHKVRYGRYPDSLRDLKFAGEWDQAALISVRYYPSPNRDAYYIEVERGWMGKPKFAVPAEFWKGTGYSPALKPESQ